jgi:hypothetical protein
MVVNGANNSMLTEIVGANLIHFLYHGKNFQTHSKAWQYAVIRKLFWS